jgi:hypothetical protein
MSMSATADSLSVMINRKPYKFEKDDLPKIKSAVAAAWKPTLRAYKAQLSSLHEIWTTQNKFREDYFFTTRIIQAAAGDYFPSSEDLSKAYGALAKLEQAVSAGNLAAIPNLHHDASKLIGEVGTLMDRYTKSMSSTATTFVSALEFTRDAAADIVEVTLQLAMVGKLGGAAAAAGMAGSYKELLNQIEQAQGSDKFSAVTATAIVITAGAREAMLKHFMGDGKFAKNVVDLMAHKVAQKMIKRFGATKAVDLIEDMCGKGFEEAVVSSLRELIKNYTTGQKVTIEQAATTVATDVLKKIGLSHALIEIDEELDKVAGVVLKKIASGAIKGVKIEGTAAENEVRKVVEAAAEKVAGKVIESCGSNLGKLATLSEEVAKQLLNDGGFKASVTKLAAKKK